MLGWTYLDLAVLDGKIDGCDVTGGTIHQCWHYSVHCAGGNYMGGIVIEGWNDLFPNAGAYGVKDLYQTNDGHHH